MDKCSGITRAGEACKGIPIENSQWCYGHHPDRAEDRRRYGVKGNRRGGRGRPQGETADIKRRLYELVDGVLDGSIARADASVASQILNIVLRAISTELDVREQAELTSRMEAIEEALERDREHAA